jgi:hypothetical protein
MFFCLLLILLHRGIKPTAAGAKAIAVDDAAEPEDAGGESATLANRDQAAIPSKLDAKDAPPAEAEPRSAGRSAPRGGSKLARVIALLERREITHAHMFMKPSIRWTSWTIRSSETFRRMRQ